MADSKPTLFGREDEAEELPTYSPPSPITARTIPRQLVTRTYSLDKHDHAWLTLHVKSVAPSSPQLPRVIEGEPVEGSVEMDAKDGVKSVSVAIIGELISDQNIRFSFVDVSQELWSSAAGDGSSEQGKLSGRQSWPYSLLLPSTVEAEADDKTQKPFRLPPTDFARYWRYSIVYTLVVTVKNSSFFTPDYTYVPVFRPPEPSPLRQMAYEAGSPLPGPDVDPEGWHSLAPVTFEGKVFGARAVAVTYVLSLAKPLSYTRGSVIPLHLVVECQDDQTLDLLSSPTAPKVRLQRVSQIRYDAGGSNKSGSQKKLSDLKPMAAMAFQDMVGWLNKATWWTTPCDESHKRTLQGEIHLKGSLNSSAHFGLYKRSYEVVLSEPSITGFVPNESKKDKAYHVVEVEIATAYPRGPRPIAYSPPTYDEEHSDDHVETRGTRFNQFTAGSSELFY
ncbi:hypothetical protein BDW22DRAFT_1347286 [Trametopsis cervina]|nr:hypothetical protein BDW22DRAFT_1347286 [Trametopsis cervina]